ncbi:MAG: type 1 glutamine amidotransferase domain-containing protein [Micropepsaceae bacterium]
MAVVLMPIPASDFDPTETGVPWKVLTGLGHDIVFATPKGGRAAADPMMVTGRGLGLLSGMLSADRAGREAYDAMRNSPGFATPMSWEEIQPGRYDGLILPGGHAKGIRQYLESGQLQSVVRTFFEASKPVGAICHGVVLAARAKRADARSVLYGHKTTALTRVMELSAWQLTRIFLGDYYRTYPVTVEEEVRSVLARPTDFVAGPISLSRDSDANPNAGFVVRDGYYVSARWPGDAHRFAHTMDDLLRERSNQSPADSLSAKKV